MTGAPLKTADQMISFLAQFAAAIPHDYQLRAAHFTIRQDPSNSDPNDNNDGDGLGDPRGSGLSKSVLEYVFISVVVFIIACIVARRYRLLRLQRPAGSNYSDMNASQRDGYRRFPNDVELQYQNSRGQPYPQYPDSDMTGFPPAHIGHNRRRTQAPDIDSRGRRLGDPTTEIDHCNLGNKDGNKDELPAYDTLGGPPKYFELNTQTLNRPPLSEAAHRPDVGLENTNNSLPENGNSREL